MYKLFVVLSLSLAGFNIAVANVGPTSSLRPTPVRVRPQAVPEIDPQSAISAATLLIGGLVVFRGRRRQAIATP